MVYFPRVSFKTGINPSLVRSFPVDGNYTGTQKLMLVKTRIFGNKIGGFMSSGMRPFREVRYSRNFADYQTYNPYRIIDLFPTYKDQYQEQYRRALQQRHALKKQKKALKKKKK